MSWYEQKSITNRCKNDKFPKGSLANNKPLEHFIRLENLLKIEKKNTENSLKLKNRENRQKFEKRLEEEEEKKYI